MTAVQPQTPTAAASSDPSQHVNYFSGMILGADDFSQEFAYHSGRDRWLARDLLGYGTVSGLRVTCGAGGPQGPCLAVDPGSALGPGGQLIRVPDLQCIDLDDWLAAPERQPEIEQHVAENLLTVYLTLCYRERPAAFVPVPGEPGPGETESTQPSRLADDFALELRFDPPDQREEDAVRDFVAWLRAITIQDGKPSSLTADEFADLIRASAAVPGSPAPLMAGPPPAGLQLSRTDAGGYLRLALRLWVTELRPRWYRTLLDWAAGPSGDCVLLAALRLPLTATPGSRKVDGPIVIDESRRPVLAHLRLAEELAAARRPQARPAPQGAAVALPAGTGAYRIVAAGVFEFDSADEQRFVQPLGRPYNNLRVVFSDPARRQIMFAFDDMEPPDFDAGHVYIVKALPWVLGNSREQSFSVRLLALSGERFVLGLDFRHPRVTERGRSGRIMIEVSEYGYTRT